MTISKPSPSQKLAIVILAAGKGSRMKSDHPKVMHRIAGRPMISWILETAESLNPEKIITVIAKGMDEVAQCVAPHPTAIQTNQKGTGDALKAALPLLEGFDGRVLVLLGDEPFLDRNCLGDMIAHDGIAVMAVTPPSVKGLGRMIVRTDGALEQIIEEADCTEAQKAITLCNAGNFCFPAVPLKDWLAQMGNQNAQGEYYLVDIPKIAEHKSGIKTKVFHVTTDISWGINTRRELSDHEGKAQNLLRKKAMDGGVTLIDPHSVTLSWDTQWGQDVIIEPHVFIGQGVVIGNHVTIHAFSYLEGVLVNDHANIGPFARLRTGSEIGHHAEVGNFVEVNRTILEPYAKAKHVSYLGDAVIGEKTNIGAGTVIANYDGFMKHKTTIGQNVFVGSNSTIISPVIIGAGAILAAGSTITKDVSEDALGLGRARQENVEGWATRYRKNKSAKKEKKK